LIHFRVKNCNGLTQHAVYCPLWASQSTHFQGFHPGPPHGFVLGSHAWLQNAYNMLATGTIYKVLALNARFWYGISQSSHLKTSRRCSDIKCNGLAQHAIYYPLWTSQSTYFHERSLLFRRSSHLKNILSPGLQFQREF